MEQFKKVAIVGVGVIGGSLALAIKEKNLARKIVGVSRHRKTISLAKQCGAIDSGACDINVLEGADLLIFAAPVSVILKLAKAVSGIINKDCIVTDVGSTKKEIVASLEKIFPNYVGSHPLAGSEKQGVLNANGELFKNSSCILTPTGRTNTAALSKIELLWEELGAKTFSLSPGIHDQVLSFVSHLPHAVAFSLLDSVPKRYLKFAASGFRDTVRIAFSDEGIWSDIFLSNRKELLKAVGSFEKSLSRIKSALKKGDKKLLSGILKKTTTKKII